MPRGWPRRRVTSLSCSSSARRNLGGQLHGLPQCHGRLVKVAIELPRRAEVGRDMKMVREPRVGGPEDADGFGRIAEPELQCPKVGGFVSGQRPLGGKLGEPIRSAM